jgi:hypothetical protein
MQSENPDNEKITECLQKFKNEFPTQTDYIENLFENIDNNLTKV